MVRFRVLIHIPLYLSEKFLRHWIGSPIDTLFSFEYCLDIILKIVLQPIFQQKM